MLFVTLMGSFYTLSDTFGYQGMLNRCCMVVDRCGIMHCVRDVNLGRMACLRAKTDLWNGWNRPMGPKGTPK
jgi:hypothetical protein